MVKVCLISHGHPAGNPRLVREAHALHDAGFDVVVITPRFVPRLVAFDREIVAGAGWRHRCVDLLPGGAGRWQFVRARRRISASLAGLVRSEALVSRACNYANPELARLAADERAALYVAHQHHSLPAAAKAAAQTGGRFAFDAEDVLADSSVEPRALIRDIERRYLAECAYISTMSEAAAARLHATNSIARPIIVLHNTLSLSARQGTESPDRRKRASPPSLYWFGQTIGPHSCAEYVLEALALMREPLRFVLRGEPTGSYVQHLRTCAGRLGLNDRLQIEPRLAAGHGGAGERSRHPARFSARRAVPSTRDRQQEVFTGMMAGLALALSDTIAHRDLMTKAPGCGFLFPPSDAGTFARQLDDLLHDGRALESQKRASWLLAEREYNWDHESRRLLTIVREWTSRTAA